MGPVSKSFRVRLLFALLSSLLCLGLSPSVGLAAQGALGKGTGGDAIAIPAIALPSLPSEAFARGVVEDDVPQVRARLLRSNAGGEHVGVLFDLEPGWHLYWRNPGGTGLAPELGLTGSRLVVGDIAWPAPQTFEEADGLFTTWGYEGSVLLSAKMERAQDAPDLAVGDANEALTIEARVRALVCRTQCVPAEFELRSPIDPELSQADQAAIDALFIDARARVPRPAASLGVSASARWKAAAAVEDSDAPLVLTLETCSLIDGPCPRLSQIRGNALFVPMEGDTFEFGTAALVEEDVAAGRAVLQVEVARLDAGEDRLRGLVPILDPSGRTHHVEIDVPIESGEVASGAPASVSASAARWLQIFLLAMLGGLILNGMPCVLPVLAIKVVAVADMAEKDPREVRMHGLAYTAGVLGSMALLAAVVLGLRSAGHSVGWGFQFQEPLFVAAISAVLVTFALNLFGVFEIELGQGRLATVGQDADGLSRSLFEGLLAVVLATPCTAPFLGTAVGFAFASSGMGIAAIFLAIGFGLASPFLLVSFFPACARFIPRSGPWMNTLRAGLGFSLLATVVWLLWVLGQSGGVDAVVSTAGMLLLLAFLLWGFGQMQPVKSRLLGRAVALAIAGIAVTGFNLIQLDRADPAETKRLPLEAEGAWQVYSPTAVADALAAGRPAFVVFTADWCITCKVNERTVLQRARVMDAFEAADYALFKADWTRRDESIRLRLAEFGRAGVPLYLVYDPDRPDSPDVLSELLSTGEMLTAIEAGRSSRRI